MVDAWRAGETQSVIARRHGLTRQRVSQILRGSPRWSPAGGARLRPPRLRPARRTTTERVIANLPAVLGDGCWEWCGSRVGAGYGRLIVEGQAIGAHRLAYEVFVGPIPDGLWVLHHCDNPPCVNPDHLFLGTALDNTRDMLAKGRGILGRTFPGQHRTRCVHGHEFTDVNVIRFGDGAPRCRTCARTRNTAYKQRRRCA